MRTALSRPLARARWVVLTVVVAWGLAGCPGGDGSGGSGGGY
jgi:hypothetical protein